MLLAARRKLRKIVLFFEPNLKQPKIKIIIDTAKNVTTENLVENYQNCVISQPNVNTENLVKSQQFLLRSLERRFQKIVLFFEPNIKHPKLNHHAAAKNVNTKNLVKSHPTRVEIKL